MASNVQKVITQIKQEKIGASSKRALIVEGKDDVFAVKSFLFKKNPHWEQSWVVEKAEQKSRVIEILKQETTWVGIVDKDEWQQEVIDEYRNKLSNLWILPRYCIENYIIVPDELWHSLPAKQQARLPEGVSQLEEILLGNLNRWVSHGVLWSVINPLWEGLRARGFKEKLLEPSIATDEVRIRATLEEWHHYLDPDRLLEQHKKRVQEVKALSVTEQLTRWVHGKMFYTNVVLQAFNALFGQQGGKKRKEALFLACPLPQDFDSLWPLLEFS